jgi:predicted transcriptional regulator
MSQERESGVNIRQFDLDAQGLGRVVGDLQARILEAIWIDQPRTVRDIAALLEGEHHPKSVMTVMNRMVEKGLLRRERQGRAYLYRATMDREAFMAGVARQVLDGLLADFRRPTLAHFVEAADADQLAELEALIRRRRRD